VIAAGQPAVVLDGGPAGRVRLHVVDLAVLGGNLAELMEALPVAHLDARRVAPVKMRRRTPRFLTRSRPSNTTRSTHAWSSQRARLPGLTTVPSASSQMRPAKVGGFNR
jgi:hypothetical protein